VGGGIVRGGRRGHGRESRLRRVYRRTSLRGGEL
jgi:hypothetical protein